MKSINKIITTLLSIFLFNLYAAERTTPLIINHTCTDITKLPQGWIELAKDSLHIAYGHTSHGSQITTGMTGLVNFANGGGKGLDLPENIFTWNNGGTDGALDLHDKAMAGDVGYYPDWVNNTREYLGEPNQNGRGSDNPDVNVIIWSWCGQAGGRSEQGMIDTYLAPMSQLELDYPNVTFVYMTGHAVGSGEEGDTHLRNQQIRNYCIANNKVLYDFYDIECYDPDGNYYGDLYVTDGCNYDYNDNGVTSQTGDPALPTNGDHNWAIDWQDSHTEGVDWYNCSAAHTQPLNSNQKAYAAWWMWMSLAGWELTTGIADENRDGLPQDIKLNQNYPNPFNPVTTIIYTVGTNYDSPLHVELAIYNMLGQKVSTLVNNKQQTGQYEAQWDATGFSAGLYFCILKTDNFQQVKKMVLIK